MSYLAWAWREESGYPRSVKEARRIARFSLIYGNSSLVYEGDSLLQALARAARAVSRGANRVDLEWRP